MDHFYSKNIEMRVRDTDGSADRAGIIEGYAAVFGVWSEDLGGFIETVEPGAFTKTLQEQPDIRATVNHNMDLLIGRTKSGTLRTAEDQHGLHFEVVVPKTSYGLDLVQNVKIGNIDQCSFTFQTVKDIWTPAAEPDGLARRRLKEVKLYELGPVTFAAYPQTEVIARSIFMVQEKIQTGAELTTQEKIILRRFVDMAGKLGVDVLAEPVQNQEPDQEPEPVQEPDRGFSDPGATGPGRFGSTNDWRAMINLTKTKTGF